MSEPQIQQIPAFVDSIALVVEHHRDGSTVFHEPQAIRTFPPMFEGGQPHQEAISLPEVVALFLEGGAEFQKYILRQAAAFRASQGDHSA